MIPHLDQAVDCFQEELSSRIDSLQARLSSRMDSLDTKFSRYFLLTIAIRITFLLAVIAALLGK